MVEVLKRTSQFEAENESIAEGQLPKGYNVDFAPPDNVVTISAFDGIPIEFTVSAFVQLVAEVNFLVGGADHLGCPPYQPAPLVTPDLIRGPASLEAA